MCLKVVPSLKWLSRSDLVPNVPKISLGLAMVAQLARLVTKLGKDKASTVTTVVKAEEENTKYHIKFLYASFLICLGNC